MDCESCGRHCPSGQIASTRSITGEVLMVCGRCRRHLGTQPGGAPDEVTRLTDIVVPPRDSDGILRAMAWFFPDLAEGLARRLLPPSIDLDGYRWLRDAAESTRAGLIG